MKVLLLALLIACGDKSTTGPAPIRNTATSGPTDALPADDAMGELALVPVPSRDTETWLPVGTGPVLVEGVLREGKGPPPSWLAVDTAGTETKLSYGKTAQLPYGCDSNAMTVNQLEGDAGKLRPGLLWLRPVARAAWTPKAAAIRNGDKVTPARRDLVIGPARVEVVRTADKQGVVTIVRDGRMVHQMTFERSDMEGADNATPINLVEGGPGVPVPEAAWTFGSDLLVIVFKVPGYEGLSFKTLVVNAQAGRAVDSMAMYLYHCAF